MLGADGPDPAWRDHLHYDVNGDGFSLMVSFGFGCKIYDSKREVWDYF